MIWLVCHRVAVAEKTQWEKARVRWREAASAPLRRLGCSPAAAGRRRAAHAVAALGGRGLAADRAADLLSGSLLDANGGALQHV